ncbi:hypothetical protein [Pelagicoccus sp. SDUM812005]|uniref:hypothetical protein n=1 Tax=Pelagicoccus sp. SDUM812005 TaxID=3041257 RepID=UPI00280CFDA1|nr:hypothetical protein [Pelagicoccus sp. SDUM812005]MDQ8180097.1 hypothetical protein [Pelagicoccus sp. SDUM812005]
MGKKTAIGTLLLIGFLAASYFLYSYFVGFERPSLARKLPADTYASLSVRHLRKLGLAFATDQQLQASVQVVQAIGKILERSFASFEFPGDKPEVDEALLLALSQHFKTQLALAALPPPSETSASIEYALLSDFYGQEADFLETLDAITLQAATSSGIEIGWQNESWNGIPYQILSPSLAALDPDLPPSTLCWAILDGTFYLCTHPQTLQKLLAHAVAPHASLADALTKHEIDKHLGAADITLLVNSAPTLQRIASDLRADLIRSGGIAASFSPHAFIDALELDHIDSLAVAMRFTGDRAAYSGITYSSEIPLLNTLVPSDKTHFPPLENTPIYSYESLEIDTGKALLEIKNAFLKAAPLAAFPYIGLRSKIKYDSGFDLEASLPKAFAPSVTYLQTVDFGTGKNEFGQTQEQVVFDFAYKFELTADRSLPTILDSQLPRLMQATSLNAYQEDGIFYLDRNWDTTLTSNRYALSYHGNSILLGGGTLKSFHALLGQKEAAQETSESDSPSPTRVGNGALSARKLPASLFQLTAVLYQQVNNTQNIPTAFMDFDWSSLAILEQERESTSYHTPSQLYRVSRQID